MVRRFVKIEGCYSHCALIKDHLLNLILKVLHTDSSYFFLFQVDPANIEGLTSRLEQKDKEICALKQAAKVNNKNKICIREFQYNNVNKVFSVHFACVGEIIKANLDLRNIIFIFLTVFDLRTIHVRGRSQTTFTRGSG